MPSRTARLESQRSRTDRESVKTAVIIIFRAESSTNTISSYRITGGTQSEHGAAEARRQNKKGRVETGELGACRGEGSIEDKPKNKICRCDWPNYN